MSAFLRGRGTKKPQRTYMLLSRESKMLGRGELVSAPEDNTIQIRLSSGSAAELAAAEVLQVIPSGSGLQPRMGRYLTCRDNLVVLESMRSNGAALRENFRMPVDFESYVYPRSGGRAFIRALDLSCGGIAMYTAQPLEVGEICEVVIPITEEGPLIVDCEILRVMPFSGPIQRYAAKFVDLIHDQEAALREAVFVAQVQAMQTGKQKNAR